MNTHSNKGSLVHEIKRRSEEVFQGSLLGCWFGVASASPPVFLKLHFKEKNMFDHQNIGSGPHLQNISALVIGVRGGRLGCSPLWDFQVPILGQIPANFWGKGTQFSGSTFFLSFFFPPCLSEVSVSVNSYVSLFFRLLKISCPPPPPGWKPQFWLDVINALHIVLLPRSLDSALILHKAFSPFRGEHSGQSPFYRCAHANF